MARASNPTPRCAYTPCMLWLLLACAKQPAAHDSGTTKPEDSGSVNGGDTGDSTDSGSGDTAHGETADSSGVTVWETEGPCGAWSGVQRTGTTWTYAASDDYVASYAMDGTFTTIAGVNEDGTITLDTSGMYKGEHSSFQFDRRDTWKCDEAGAWWVRNESNATSKAGSSQTTIAGWRTFSPGWLVRPATAETSATWADEFVLESEVNGIPSEPVTAHCASTVGAAEMREVDGGQFSARPLSVECDVLNGNSKWISEYLGVIETADEVLAAYVP